MRNFLTASQQKEKEENPIAAYLRKMVLGLFLIPLLNYFFPSAIGFGMFEFFHWGNPLHWLYAGLPIFIWGAGLTALQSFTTRNDWWENAQAEAMLRRGTGISLWAGVMEELAFRWLLFLPAICGVKITNYIFFGWLGFGIPKLIHLWIVGPIANFTTLGALHDQLLTPTTWAVGAAMLATNAFFRDGHKYQGLFGLINSWFLGMYFFYLLFHYGILAAILVHFTYDFLIFFVRYIDMVIERRRFDARLRAYTEADVTRFAINRRPK